MVSGLLNFAKTVFFNFRYLPFKQAVHLPIQVTLNLKKIKIKRGQIILKKYWRKSVRLGCHGSIGLQEFSGGIYLSQNSKLIFHGSARIGQGTVLRCDENAVIEIGEGFYCNKNCFFKCTDKIVFGDRCIVGWNVQINTINGHRIWEDGIEKKDNGSIIIGDHVWLTSNVIITKGVTVSEESVVAQGAVLTSVFLKKHVLIGGVPAKVIKENISWTR